MTPEDYRGLQNSQDTIDFKALFFKILGYWYLFVLVIFISTSTAFLFNSYSVPLYQVNTKILIKDNNSGLGPSSMLGGLGLMNNKQNIENEIIVLKSYSLVYRVMQKLDFEVSYFVNNGFFDKELYHTSPFEVVFDTNMPQALNEKFHIEFISKNYLNL